MLKDLQEGLLVGFVEKEKKEIIVKVNQEFFEVFPTLLQRLQAKISP